MMRRTVTLLAALASAALLLIGCAAQPPADTSDLARADAEYMIGPGDTLQVYVRNNPDLSVTLPVRPDGRISVPMVQGMQAAGKSATELAADIEDALSEFIRTPTVTVMVTEFVGAFGDQVRILGEAIEPRAISYRRGMTVLDAVIEVGGITEFAAGNRTKLIRRGEDGEPKTYTVRLDDLINDGDISANVRLVPGDIILIPEAFF